MARNNVRLGDLLVKANKITRTQLTFYKLYHYTEDT